MEQHDQPLAAEFLANVVYQRGFFFAVFTPGRPELEQYDLAFDGIVVEQLAGGGPGAKTRSGLAGFTAAMGGKSEECSGKTRSDHAAPKHAAHLTMEFAGHGICEVRITDWPPGEAKRLSS